MITLLLNILFSLFNVPLQCYCQHVTVCAVELLIGSGAAYNLPELWRSNLCCVVHFNSLLALLKIFLVNLHAWFIGNRIRNFCMIKVTITHCTSVLLSVIYSYTRITWVGVFRI